jgi:dTDP-4-amino-4,6-dideoxygalactose transaminase
MSEVSSGVTAVIPFNRPSFLCDELSFIKESIQRGHIAGDGTFTKEAQLILEEALGAARVLLTTSCTHALEMAAMLLEVQPEDEVIVPSFTFVSTANAFAIRGARPVFCDVRPDTLNLDETRLETLITSRTKAIVPVHYAGVGCEMEAIMAIAQRHGVPVVEDNAHGLFGAYRGRPLGTFGSLASQSFHETKNFSCGEGGALVINDPSLVGRAEILREKGTDRSRFLRGQVDKYTWVDIGSSYVVSDLLASILVAQLAQRDRIQDLRRLIWERYADSLVSWSKESGIGLPMIPEHCDQAYHMYYLLMPSFEERCRFIDFLREERIMAVFHYVPLHSAPFARSFHARGECPVSENVSKRLVRLPFFTSMSLEEQQRVIDVVTSFRCHSPVEAATRW